MASKKRIIINHNKTGQDEMNKVTLGHKIQNAILGIRYSYRLFILPVLLVFCTLFYYFGELVDWAAWTALRREFFYGVHDIHRLLFLIPIIYAGYVGRVKGAIIITLVAFIIFLPRAFFISPFPDPLLRMILFTIIAGVIGSLTGVIRNKSDRAGQLESMIRDDRDILLRIIDSMADGLLIISPDYKIRFTNSIMLKEFGDGIGSFCYKYLHNLDAPCEQGCMMQDIIAKKQMRKWKYKFQDKTYDIFAAPYIDDDGVVCQLLIFRNII